MEPFDRDDFSIISIPSVREARRLAMHWHRQRRATTSTHQKHPACGGSNRLLRRRPGACPMDPHRTAPTRHTDLLPSNLFAVICRRSGSGHWILDPAPNGARSCNRPPGLSESLDKHERVAVPGLPVAANARCPLPEQIGTARLRGHRSNHRQSKSDGNLGHNFLKGRRGDRFNAVMNAVGYYLRLNLKWVRKLSS